jgi:formyl-CoA transferase
VLAAPVTATFLGDFGADVVKVEEPGVGDFTRARAPQRGGRSPQWLQEARNKRSITLDLRQSEGQAILRQLVPHFDVVVTNYRPPTLARWGMSPEEMRPLNPRAVILFLTGYGLTGPYRDRGAFDRVASSFAGLTYASGEPDGDPVRCGYSVLDYMSAYLAAFSVVTALYNRDVHGGDGQVIDLALYEAGVRASEDAIVDYSINGTVRQRFGNRSPHIVPAGDFTSKDGRRVSLHAATDTLFQKLLRLIGREDLAEDRRFIDRRCRVENQDELYSILDAWTANYAAAELVTMLNDAGIPSSTVMNVADIVVDPHIQERGTLMTVSDAEYGDVTMVAPLPHLSDTPGKVRTLGPRLGEHNSEIYGELLGLSGTEIDCLQARGVI